MDERILTLEGNDNPATNKWQSISQRLVAALKPYGSPIGISFLSEGAASPVGRCEDEYPEPNEHGRTGQVPAQLLLVTHKNTDFLGKFLEKRFSQCKII